MRVCCLRTLLCQSIDISQEIYNLIVFNGQKIAFIIINLTYDDKTKKVAYTMLHQRPFRKFDIITMQIF